MCFGGLLPNPDQVSSGAARPPYAPHTFVAIWAGTRWAARASCSGLSRNRRRRHRALRHRRAEIQDAAETVAVQGAPGTVKKPRWPPTGASSPVDRRHAFDHTSRPCADPWPPGSISKPATTAPPNRLHQPHRPSPTVGGSAPGALWWSVHWGWLKCREDVEAGAIQTGRVDLLLERP